MNFNNTLWYGSRLGGEDKGSEIDVQMMGVMTKAAAQGRAPQDNFKAVHCIVERLDLQDSAKLDAGQCKTRCRTVQNWLVPEQQLYIKQTLQ